jgi:hypothetical protein
MQKLGLWIGTTALLLLLLLVPAEHGSARPQNIAKAEISIKASPNADYATRQAIPLARLLSGAVSHPDSPVPSTDTYLTVTEGGEQAIVYRIDPDGDLHKEDGVELQLRPAERARLLKAANALRAKHYGELLPWEQAKTVIPRKAKVKVIDLETGLSFNAQRRAGSSHADVQPLTKADTEIMKQIYNGRWSWQRRAILVESNGRVLAASMHGMPHGGDGIPNNGFRGHFCIHFLGSETHGKGNVDLGHQLMVAKASGTLDAFERQLDPYDVINAFFLANEYGDSQLLAELFPDARHAQAGMSHFGAEDGTVRHQFVETEEALDELVAADIQVETCLIRGSKCADKTRSIFQMRRLSPVEPWRIDWIEKK